MLLHGGYYLVFITFACIENVIGELTTTNNVFTQTTSTAETSTAVTPSVGGPNVCRSRYQNYCCPGWTLKPGTGLCVIPICWRHCGDVGRCIKPNICMCESGFLGPTCSTKPTLPGGNGTGTGPSSLTNCPYPCLNGGSCINKRCVCAPGYTGNSCSEPVCKDPCLNGGQCIGPDRCACVYGYAGRRCEADYRVGPCFTKIVNDMCQAQLQNVVCTKQLCCATVGRAWGHPCEHCPLQLECQAGYLKNLNSGQCIDIDECEAIPGLCEGGSCVNTPGSFRCTCPEGKSRNPINNICEDLDECKEDTSKKICQHGFCVNTDSSYYCICDAGYIPTQDRKHCIDTKQGNCFTSVTNRNECRDPLPMKLSVKDCCCGRNMGQAWGDKCDACPSVGTEEFSVLCLGGSHISSSTVITLVDECMLRAGICGGGRCLDLPEGYICDCYPGYTKKKNVDSQVCEDIDECSQGLCKGGKCTNSPGTFICTCPAGFDVSSDGKQCIDHDECRENGMCANGVCINMDGSFKCQCKSGFSLSTTGHACMDIDECYENPLICLNGRCVNTAGSYRCDCRPGFIHTADGAFCVDINECITDPTICENGRCINSDGSYQCVCNSGYQLSSDRKVCIDIDECASKVCQNGKCINTIGSFRCECPHGFTLGPDGRSCLDTIQDLCYLTYHDGQCSKPSSSPLSKSSCCCCTKITGYPMAWGTPCSSCPKVGTAEFDSLCPHGSGTTFMGDDINECAQNPAICENGACENLIGTYRCICNAGFEVDSSGKVCVDINECEKDVDICNGGQCKNTVGGFQCICPSGTQFSAVTNTCVDVDECAELGIDACTNGRCVNTVGAFECVCPAGMIIDNTGRVCLDNRRGTCWTKMTAAGTCENSLGKLTLKSECCCSVGLAWGSPCEQCHIQECGCAKGYAKLDGKSCTDVNECELHPGLCRGGGTCVNTEGSFTCVCPPGLTLDSSGTVCQDQRSDVCYTEYKYGTGSGPPLVGFYSKAVCCCSTIGKAWGGSDSQRGAKLEPCPRNGTLMYSDLCPKGPGFIERRDINECVEFPGICIDGHCKNFIGGFSCVCNPGFTLDENGIKCIDIDECSITRDICGAEGECQNVPGKFVCKCRDGYESHPLMLTCVDVDECLSTTGLCTGGKCINVPGGFRCECPPGHELSSDMRSCKDIDECSRTSGICSNGICENMMGTYQCICDNGYQQTDQKSHCEDIDECIFDDGGCEEICINTPGSYICSCKSGLKLMTDGRSCADIDECKEDVRICNGGECVNNHGGYICICSSGLTSGPNNSSCIDINECEGDATKLCGNGECINIVGSYFCQCEDGYSVKPEIGPLCTDEDECELGTHNCDKNALCINNPGSYSCRCIDGFNGNGISCTDINECLTNNGGCDKNAQCINTDGSFKCACDEGFRGDGYFCDDVDECVENPRLCDNGHCFNYAGSYRCECDMGFMNPDDKNQQQCVDINECQVFSNLCVFGHCENMIGSFRCECDRGYQSDSSAGNCTDINECESPQACLYGNCTNTEGGFICKCPPNYQLSASGNACVDRRESRCYMSVEEQRGGRRRCLQETGVPVTKATCCCSIGRAWGGRCELCPLPETDEYKTLCPGGHGYRPNTTSVVLEDINECEEHQNLCKNGHCTNTFGGYMCMCNEGFRLDNSSYFCNDINECVENLNACGPGFCINDEGSYHCVCPDGYMVLPNAKECIDMRKEYCYLNFTRGICSEPMSGEQTRMICCCSMGQAWGQPCEPCPPLMSTDYVALCGSRPGVILNPMTNKTEEIDECALMPQLCNHGVCVNTPSSFECICDNGYIYDKYAHQCIDENECLRIPSPCSGNGQCINSPGGYECRCPEGYKLGLTAKQCVDVDECIERYGICQNGECTNLNGSFQCQCHTGYSLTASRDNCVDIDECQRQPNICNNGTCVNTVGAYKCNCYAGFKLSHNNDCIDVDECALMPHLCRNGRCKNTIGSFRCDCVDGYLVSQDGQYCRDIDECKEQGSICPSPGRCQNLMGSFLCTCPLGYRLSANKTICVDIDECVETPGVCEGGKCINTDGGMICECPEGFDVSRIGAKCVDVRQDFCYDSYKNDKCSAPRHNMKLTMKECCCSMGAGWGRNCDLCPSKESGAFKKLCPEGPGRADSGQDLNECILMPDICDGGECINTDGSFRCECPPGFVLDFSGKKCIDDNECLKANACGNGTCTNLVGSFECSCAEGFLPGPSQICEDINECLETSNQCAFRCHNVVGSFRCICPYGYALAPDGKHCTDVDECLTPANNCKYQCKNLIGTFTCICPEGYIQTGGADGCQDINECLINRHVCENGRCLNTPGSYQCDCFNGFKTSSDGKQCIDDRVGVCYRQLVNNQCVNNLSDAAKKMVTRMDCCCTLGVAWGAVCQICPTPKTQEYQQLCSSSGYGIGGHDIDECETMPDLCKHGRCINTPGSYRCICNRGFKVDYTGTRCIDINECLINPSPCQISCENTEGGYICSCPPGYALHRDNSTCKDIDECLTGKHICQQKCINTQGSYECSCNPGYKKVGDHCLDVDECSQSMGICPTPGTCINTLGSYRCVCPRGFKLDPSGTYCVDLAECPSGKCEKGCQPGSGGKYQCDYPCPEGLTKHPYFNECIDINECLQSPCGGIQCINTAGSYQCICPGGYRFDDASLSCIRGSGVCSSSPCSFGCTPTPIGGYTCECPSGYQRIAQGHCLSSVSPVSSYSTIPDLGNIPVYPIESGPYSSGTGDKLSSEGCFSCKVNNNRHKRTSVHSFANASARGNNSSDSSSWNEESISFERNQKGSLRHHHGDRNEPHLLLSINTEQTKQHTPVLKFQPATKDIVEYVITDSVDAKQFRIAEKNNVWILHFRHKVKQSATFHVGIAARKISSDQHTNVLHLKILVVPSI